MKNTWSLFVEQYSHTIKYENFYKNIVKIFNSDNIACIFDNTNIINEQQHPEVKYGQKIISLIDNYSYLTILKFNDLIKYIPKNWKYYDNLLNTNNKKDIFIFKTDFTKPKFLFHLFEKLGYVKYPFSQSYENILKNDFIVNVGICDGACIFLQNVSIMFLNTSSYNKTIISHELTHYFQDILEINLLDADFNYDTILNRTLQLNEEEFKYVFSEKEFFTHIYVDLYQQLKKIFFKHYYLGNKNLKTDFKKYINYIKDEIINDPLHIFDSEFGKIYLKEVSNFSPLAILSAIYILNKDDLFNKCILDLQIID